MSGGEPLIELQAEDLEVAYREYVALRVPSLSVRGRIIAIIGHNGSGKSTMIKTALKLLIPRRGALNVAGLVSGKRSYLLPERDMAFSPETGAIFEDVTVENYIQLWCRLKQNDAFYYRKQGSAPIERFNLSPLLGKLGRELSKGQRQRVQAAIGFLTSPRLFLFDEPFDGLDLKQSADLAGVIQEESRHTAIIVSSHRVEVIERLADQVIILKEGGVLACGTVDQVCRVLCEQSVVLQGAPGTSDVSRLLLALRQNYLSCLISQVGAQISLIGPGLDLEQLRRFLQEQKLSAYEPQLNQPSLSDAMSYHLRRTQH